MHFLLECLLVLFSLRNVQGGNVSSFKVDKFTISKELKPYDWFYIRVDLPPLFSSTWLQLDPRLDLEIKGQKTRHVSEPPIICFRNGGLPLPDISNGSELLTFPTSSTGSMQNLLNSRHCYFLLERTRIQLTNEQVSPGVLFIGLFNRIGAARTQAKMINRGSTFLIMASVILQSCMNHSMVGSHCNQKVEQLLCHHSSLFDRGPSVESKMADHNTTRMLSCDKFSKDLCHQDHEPKFFSLDVMQPPEKLVVSAFGSKDNQTRLLKTDYANLLCYAQYGAVPTNMSYAYSVDLSIAPMVISLPKVGKWYFMIQPFNKSNAVKGRGKNVALCYSLQWGKFQCPMDKAGPNCTWQNYMLQLNDGGISDAFFAYTPKNERKPVKLDHLALEPLLTNASWGKQSDLVWTYFVFDINEGSSGKNIHIDLMANAVIDFELYARFGGLPSTSDWDYYYINQANNSDNGSMFKLYESSERRINANIFYPTEGLWCIGLRHPVLSSNATRRTTLSLSVEGCPNKCSGHGICKSNVAGEKYYRYYFCECNGRYGGFDCNVQLVPDAAQIWHVIFLTASNAAAVLPAIWAFHKKAFAESVIFSCSGIASALYHACDVGTWCVLAFQPLQFMDFWLSFMAVVSTLIYLAFINEASKRTIQTIASIVTALLAVHSPTRSRNIAIVLALGAFGLLVAWMIELVSKYKSNSSSLCSRWATRPILRSWIPNVINTIKKQFRWYFLLLGFAALSLAVLSWTLETVQTYWLWHSVWHVSIYTSAFFFLCSRRPILQDHQSLGTLDSSVVTVHQNGH